MTSCELPDTELACNGPVAPDVLVGGSARLERMQRLRDFCGSEFEHVRKQLLAALVHPERRSLATVQCVIALAPMRTAESSA